MRLTKKQKDVAACYEAAEIIATCGPILGCCTAFRKIGRIELAERMKGVFYDPLKNRHQWRAYWMMEDGDYIFGEELRHRRMRVEGLPVRLTKKQKDVAACYEAAEIVATYGPNYIFGEELRHRRIVALCFFAELIKTGDA